MRLFIGITPEASVQARIEALCRAQPVPQGRWLRWIPVESLHLTLVFLGKTPETAVAELAAALDRELAGATGPLLQLTGPRWFPGRRRPRVLALAIEPDARLSALQAAVSLAVSDCGMALERRPFRPHLSIARVRAAVPEDYRLAPADPAAAIAWQVRRVVLVHSQLGTGPARYQPLHLCPLAVAAPRAAGRP